jgi:hypothetical protein
VLLDFQGLVSWRAMHIYGYQPTASQARLACVGRQVGCRQEDKAAERCSDCQRCLLRDAMLAGHSQREFDLDAISRTLRGQFAYLLQT